MGIGYRIGKNPKTNDVRWDIVEEGAVIPREIFNVTSNFVKEHYFADFKLIIADHKTQEFAGIKCKPADVPNIAAALYQLSGAGSLISIASWQKKKAYVAEMSVDKKYLEFPGWYEFQNNSFVPKAVHSLIEHRRWWNS